MVSYEGQLEIYLKELLDMTVRVAMLESSPDNYIKLDFELLRIELREFEVLVSQLKRSLNSTSPMFDKLHTEVTETFLFNVRIKWFSSLLECYIFCLISFPDPQHDPDREPTGDV